MSLRETIKKVLKENINENREHSPQFRRRIGLLKDFIYNSFPMLYPCDFENFDHFMYAINSEIQEYSSGVYDTDDNNRTPDWLIYKEGIDFVEKYMVEDLKRHFDEMCAMEDDLNESTSHHYRTFYDEDEVNLFEKVIVKLMKKYDWFKGIDIELLSYDERTKVLNISGVVDVDEEWAANQWMRLYDSRSLKYRGEIVLSEIVNIRFGYILRDDFSSTFEYTFGQPVQTFSLNNLYLKFIPREENDDKELNEVFDDIKGTPLYHKTSASRALDIINSDSLRSGSLPSGDYLSYDKRLANTKHQNAISFTRDKNWEPGHTIGIGLESPLEDADITFVVDRDKLRTKYRVEPFNYFGIEPDYEHKEKNDELEERVMTNEIYPLRKYVIDIIYNGNNPKIQRKIDNYLNR